MPTAAQYRPVGTLPNTPLAVSIISAGLGGMLFGGMALVVTATLKQLDLDQLSFFAWARPQLAAYIAAMGLFHLAEFWTTAGWNPQKLSVDAFLLNNGRQYHYAHLFGLAEYIVSSYAWPKKFDSVWCSPYALLGCGCLLLAAQALRSMAMIQASVSFSHIVKSIKHDDHTLVTSGVYGWSRHPSYAGFFYWAIATQLLLGNVVSTFAFVIVLGRFFSARIKGEERHLVRFFEDDYVQYRKRVGTGLPFLITVT